MSFFPQPTFTDESEDLASADGEVDAVDRPSDRTDPGCGTRLRMPRSLEQTS